MQTAPPGEIPKFQTRHSKGFSYRAGKAHADPPYNSLLNQERGKRT